jgi:DNA-binding GntR family transcriptional regulator
MRSISDLVRIESAQRRNLSATKWLYDVGADIAHSHQVLLDAIRAGDPFLAGQRVEAHIRETAE